MRNKCSQVFFAVICNKFYAWQFVVFALGFVTFLFFPSITHSTSCITGETTSRTITTADQPSDISVAPNGDVYLVDGVNNRIMVLDEKGKLKFTFGTRGVGPGEFDLPLGIDISKDEKVFIADTGNHRIQSFDLNGKFVHTFTVASGEKEKPSDPVDILASKFRNYLYISDNDNHKIRVYNQNGEFEFEWGKFGEGPGEFRYPGMLSVNDYNEIFVVDVLNTRVQKFDPFGNFIAQIGSWGVFPGNFFRPKGVAFDRKGRIFVSDSYMGVIQVFTELGRFEGIVCEKGAKKKLFTPVGMFFNHKENILKIVEMRSNSITSIKLIE